MRRFSLIARLGAEDTETVTPVQSDAAVYEIDFLRTPGRIGFGLDRALEQLSELGLRPTERAIDLAILAAIVNAGDTRISRALNAQDGWTREIDLYVPVSAPEVWNRARGSIERLLQFLTGDRWRVFFRGRPKPIAALAPEPAADAVGDLTETSLLSGGLDSLIGAIDALAAGRCPLFVSHYWDGDTSVAQDALLRELTAHYAGTTVHSVRARVGFDRNALATGEKESSQRGRSFLFYALAALAASAFDQPTTVNVPENGLIALNVPLDPLRLGALSTRTAHPHVIARMNRLVTTLDLGVRFVNAYRHMTKGEMVAACADKDFLRKLVASSMSCSSPSTKARYLKLSSRHCGYCVPCLIRRASLRAGLGGKDPTLYLVPNLRAQTLATDRPQGKHVRAFQLMARRLKRAPSLASILVHKPGPLVDAPEEIADYADVFRRGVLEVAALLRGVKAEPSG